jgi:hypothetical protein
MKPPSRIFVLFSCNNEINMGLIGMIITIVKWSVIIAVLVILGYAAANMMKRESFDDPPKTSNVTDVIDTTAAIDTVPTVQPQISNSVSEPAVAGGICPPENRPLTTAQKVVQSFSKELGRMPTNDELRHYAIIFKGGFDEGQMLTLLRSSSEYKHMSKMQTNLVNAENARYMTEREIDMFIRKTYLQVYGLNPSPEKEEYLRQKLREMDLDCNAFKIFLQNLKAIESSGQVTPGLSAPGQGIQQPILVNQPQPQLQCQPQPQIQYPILPQPQQPQQLPNPLPKDYDLYNGKLDEVAQCVERNDRQNLSDFTGKRNQNLLKDVCDRNSDYARRDARMVLIPQYEWTVPQTRPPVCQSTNGCIVNPVVDQTALIGTLLGPAYEETQVGSILPTFSYKQGCDPTYKSQQQNTVQQTA